MQEIDLKGLLYCDVRKLCIVRHRKIHKSLFFIGPKAPVPIFDADHQSHLRAVAHHHQNRLPKRCIFQADDSNKLYVSFVRPITHCEMLSDQRTLQIPEGAQEEQGSVCIGFAVG